MTKAKATKRAAKLTEDAEALKASIEEIRDECQDYYDDRSEKWQEGDAGTEYMEMIDKLNEAVDNADALLDDLNSVGGME